MCIRDRNIDGEILTGKDIEFEILKGAINVIYPVGTIKECVANF